MAVAHSSLTGTDLHEIKGASSATSGQVPVANGAGGAPFGLLTHTSLSGTGNPFGAQLLHVREQASSSVNSTFSASSGSWNICPLNTVVTNEISSASLSTNTITLPAGTYFIMAQGTPLLNDQNTGYTSYSKARLRNTGAGTTVIVGRGNVFVNHRGSGADWLMGRFTTSGSTQLQLQLYTINTFGPQALATGEAEVYAEVYIWKVA